MAGSSPRDSAATRRGPQRLAVVSRPRLLRVSPAAGFKRLLSSFSNNKEKDWRGWEWSVLSMSQRMYVWKGCEHLFLIPVPSTCTVSQLDPTPGRILYTNAIVLQESWFRSQGAC